MLYILKRGGHKLGPQLSKLIGYIIANITETTNIIIYKILLMGMGLDFEDGEGAFSGSYGLPKSVPHVA